MQHGMGWAKACLWSPLHTAAQHGHTEIVQALMAAGADVDATSSAVYLVGRSPLQPSMQ